MFKKATKKQWVSIAIMVAGAVVITIIFYVLHLKSIVDFPSSYVTALIGFVYLFIGWIVPNNIEFKYRKKTAQYAGDLPQDVKDNKFTYRFPLICASMITLILSVIFDYLLIL